MYCTRCGQLVDPQSRFCEHCGAPAEENTAHLPSAGAVQPPVEPTPAPRASFAPYEKPPAPPRNPPVQRKKANIPAIVLGVVCVLLAAAFAMTALGVTDAVFSPRKTFATPEAAIEYFIDRVKAGDYESALNACASEEIALHYDYQAMIEKNKAISASSPSFMPGEYGMYAAYNEAYAEQRILSQLRFMALSAVLPDEYADYMQGTPVTESSSSIDFDRVTEDMDPHRVYGRDPRRHRGEQPRQ